MNNKENEAYIKAQKLLDKARKVYAIDQEETEEGIVITEKNKDILKALDEHKKEKAKAYLSNNNIKFNEDSDVIQIAQEHQYILKKAKNYLKEWRINHDNDNPVTLVDLMEKHKRKLFRLEQEKTKKREEEAKKEARAYLSKNNIKFNEDSDHPVVLMEKHQREEEERKNRERIALRKALEDKKLKEKILFNSQRKTKIKSQAEQIEKNLEKKSLQDEIKNASKYLLKVGINFEDNDDPVALMEKHKMKERATKYLSDLGINFEDNDDPVALMEKHKREVKKESDSRLLEAKAKANRDFLKGK